MYPNLFRWCTNKWQYITLKKCFICGKHGLMDGYIPCCIRDVKGLVWVGINLGQRLKIIQVFYNNKLWAFYSIVLALESHLLEYRLIRELTYKKNLENHCRKYQCLESDFKASWSPIIMDWLPTGTCNLL